jgi:hypothetical protein
VVFAIIEKEKKGSKESREEGVVGAEVPQLKQSWCWQKWG